MKIKIAASALSALFLLTACGFQNSAPEVSQVITSAETSVSETSAVTSAETSVSETSAVTSAETSVSETSAVTSAETSVSETSTVTSAETSVSETSAVTSAETSVSETSAVTSAETSVSETSAVTSAETSVSETSAVTSAETSVSETSAVTSAETSDEPEVPSIEIEGKTCILVFEENFDGDTLDETKWNRCEEWDRQDLNNRWDDDMSYLDGSGNLVIEMSYNADEDKYLSGAVNTKGKFEQTFGYYEIKCKVNEVPGYWTAFWLMGECVGNIGNGGRDGTEIDIMETAYYPTKEVQNTLNWDGYGSSHRASGNVTTADVYDGKFHTFALLWTKTEYIFYIDGEISWRTDASTAMGTCREPLYMKITSEMGSWTKNQKLTPELLPDRMLVDYVKVYSLSDN